MREEKSNVLRKVWEGNQRQCKVLSILWKQSFGKSGIPQAVQKQTSKETKKKKWLWMVGVAVILAAGGGIALGLNQNPKPQSDPQAATAKNEKAVENKDT